MHEWTFMLLAGALHLAFWVLLIGAVVWLVLRLSRRPGAPLTEPDGKRREEIPPRRPRLRSWAPLIGIALVVLGLVGGLIAATTSVDSEAMMRDGHMGRMMGGETESRAPSADIGAPTERVVAGDFYFRPEEIRVPAAGTLNIRFTNGGRIFHTFTVGELDFDLRAKPGATISGALRGAAPGTYVAVCTVPGHAQAGMRAAITVT
ncbi:MAG: cupredoxin domain-containing protein [Actinomycetota bacterium]